MVANAPVGCCFWCCCPCFDFCSSDQSSESYLTLMDTGLVSVLLYFFLWFACLCRLHNATPVGMGHFDGLSLCMRYACVFCRPLSVWQFPLQSFPNDVDVENLMSCCCYLFMTTLYQNIEFH